MLLCAVGCSFDLLLLAIWSNTPQIFVIATLAGNISNTILYEI